MKIDKLIDKLKINNQKIERALNEVKTETTMLDNAIKQNKQTDKVVGNLMSSDKASISIKELNHLKVEIKLLSSQLDLERQLTSQNEHDKKLKR
ncbi:hypothetical protein QNJ24_02145 [Macrococcus caseolyticus]|uniref:hypothetical protein n=1 Tax=Macrococcoides caseolyticum TaxID=69966 RepID=UPI0024BCF94B|nr:hypothetical protein [Macrococcus caseolyticus]MDJ1154887.1 hypothetical protein [Macrococcus caseolyticus]